VLVDLLVERFRADAGEQWKGRYGRDREPGRHLDGGDDHVGMDSHERDP
jgi:hypothetical protein